MADLIFQRVDAATVADALAGSELERMPGPGVYRVWLASTVNTATLTATQGQLNIARAQALPLRTSGMPNLSDDPPLIIKVVDGNERFIIQTGGTSGTIYQVHRFTPIEDL